MARDPEERSPAGLDPEGSQRRGLARELGEGTESIDEAAAEEGSFGIEYAQLDKAVKPIYLLADSQLLFWKPDGVPFIRSVRQRLRVAAPSAAYVGASNGDEPAFYQIFEAAMEDAGIEDCRMIPTELSAEDLEFIDTAHLVLLAGGDVERGWNAFVENGLKRILVRRYYEGALLMGISAGAVQLGLGCLPDANAGAPEQSKLIDTFRLLPHVIGAHQEAEEWAPLKASLRAAGSHARGYGIPTGGGFAYHPDHVIEPLRRPLVELDLRGERIRQSMLLPGRGVEPADSDGEEDERADEAPGDAPVFDDRDADGDVIDVAARFGNADDGGADGGEDDPGDDDETPPTVN